MIGVSTECIFIIKTKCGHSMIDTKISNVFYIIVKNTNDIFQSFVTKNSI